MRKRLRSKAFLRKSRLLFSLILKFLLFALVIFLICIFIKRSDFFKVKDIKVLGAETFVNKKDLENVLYSSVVNKNILEINTSQLRISVLTNFQGARDIDVKKIFPSKIIVNVYERTPIALLQNNKTDEIFIVDNEGYILGTVANSASNLPRIYYEGDIKIGHFIDRKFAPIYLELITSIDMEKIQVSSISMDEKDITLYTNNSIEVVLEKAENIGSNIKILSSLLRQLKTEGKSAKKVDLRYDKVIVSYE